MVNFRFDICQEKMAIIKSGMISKIYVDLGELLSDSIQCITY